MSSSTAEQLIRQLDATMNMQKWSSSARLCLVGARNVTEPYLCDVPYFGLMVSGGIRPQTAVEICIDAIGGTPAPDGAYGWLLVTRTWAVTQEQAPSDKDKQRILELAEQGSLHTAPERQDTRTLILASFSGELVLLIRDKARILNVVRHGGIDPDGGVQKLDGSIPNVMRRLAEVTRRF